MGSDKDKGQQRIECLPMLLLCKLKKCYSWEMTRKLSMQNSFDTIHMRVIKCINVISVKVESQTFTSTSCISAMRIRQVLVREQRSKSELYIQKKETRKHRPLPIKTPGNANLRVDAFKESKLASFGCTSINQISRLSHLSIMRVCTWCAFNIFTFVSIPQHVYTPFYTE